MSDTASFLSDRTIALSRPSAQTKEVTAFVALAVFCGWALVLTLALVAWRIALVRRGVFRWSGFTSGERHGPHNYWRLNRVHTNTTENLGLFAALVVVGSQLGGTSSLFDTLAWVVVLARIAQSSIHLRSARSRAVVWRGYAYLTQQFAQIAMLLSLL